MDGDSFDGFDDDSSDDNFTQRHIDGLVQDCSNSIANVLELLQSCTKTWRCCLRYFANIHSFVSETIRRSSLWFILCIVM